MNLFDARRRQVCLGAPGCTRVHWVQLGAPGTIGCVAERDRRAENRQEQDMEGPGEEAVLLMDQVLHEGYTRTTQEV